MHAVFFFFLPLWGKVGAKAAEAADAAGDVQVGGGGQFADIKVDFRLAKPDSNDFWENTITERLEVTMRCDAT